MNGYYYLHINGDLIWKRNSGGIVADFRESDFVRMFWVMDPNSRECAWKVLVEALAIGANSERIADLAKKWQCDDDDAQIYARQVGALLRKDGDSWCASRSDFVNLQESVAGFGATCLEALSDLAKNLGFKGSKMWGSSFRDLLAVHESDGELNEDR